MLTVVSPFLTKFYLVCMFVMPAYYCQHNGIVSDCRTHEMYNYL